MMDREYAAQWWMAMLYLGIVAVSMLTATALIRINEIGPLWFWSNNACPGTTVTPSGEEILTVCGMVPMGPILVMIVGVVLIGYGVRALPDPAA